MNKELFYRHLDLIREAVDTEKRMASMICSSETTEVMRWFGREVLSHHPEHVRMERDMSVLFNHQPERIVGPIKTFKLDKGVSKAEMLFDETDEGNLRMKQAASGSLHGVSTGYRVHKFRELAEDEEWLCANGKKIKGGGEGDRTYVAIDWEPVEISLTPIPADVNTGIGRELTRSLEGIEIEHPAKQEKLFTETTETGKRSEAQTEKTKGGGDMDPKILQEALDKRDQEHREGLKKLYDRASAIGQEALVFCMIAEGKDERTITDALFEAIGKERGTPGDPGEDTKGRDVKLEGIDDETLTRGLISPTLVTLN